ncbi:hypothetical protein ACMFMG_003413 [Clarireedia jacksonii]
MATHKACNTIPPVKVADYEEKGTWETISGLPVYISGPSTPKTALMVIYDIFGTSPQTLQGADLLAAALAPLSTAVIVPDFFQGKGAKAEWFAPDASEAAKAEKTDFMGKAYDYENWGKMTRDLVGEFGKRWDGVSGWASLGLCWGGKVLWIFSYLGEI